jgi:hypothetical protein
LIAGTVLRSISCAAPGAGLAALPAGLLAGRALVAYAVAVRIHEIWTGRHGAARLSRWRLCVGDRRDPQERDEARDSKK